MGQINNETMQAEKTNFDLSKYVISIFEKIKEQNVDGIHLKMISGNIANVQLLPVDGKVCVRIDGIEMGYFEKYTNQSYQCVFVQQYRKGIKEGRTENELLMESICNNDQLILLHKAYN